MKAAEAISSYQTPVQDCERFHSLGIEKNYSVLVLFLFVVCVVGCLFKGKGLETTGLSFFLDLIEGVVALFISQPGGERIFSTNRESN